MYKTTELESYSEHQNTDYYFSHQTYTHLRINESEFEKFFQKHEIIISYLATLDEKERTFDAFTKHTRELIEKEKFLNKRLRAYSLQMPAASSTSDNAVDK